MPGQKLEAKRCGQLKISILQLESDMCSRFTAELVNESLITWFDLFRVVVHFDISVN